MKKTLSVIIKKKIQKFNNIIVAEGDKSISHRCLLLASQCRGVSHLRGVLEAEDIQCTINCLKNLGVKILKKKDEYQVFGNGLNSFRTPKKKELFAGNSGTLARILIGLLSTNPNLKIKVFGDKSLNSRDMLRITDPLSMSRNRGST